MTRSRSLLLCLIPCALVACRNQLPNPDAAGRDVSRAHRLPAPALRPLTDAQVDDARSILEESGELAVGQRLVSVDLVEPAKDASAKSAVRAEAIVFDRATGVTRVITLDLHAHKVVDRRDVPHVQPMMGPEDFDTAEKLVRADTTWRAAMKRRGIEDFESVYLDVWAPGAEPVTGLEDVRLARVLSSMKGKQKNPYGPPIEGVVAVVDLTNERVVSVSDTAIAPISKTSTDFFDPRVRGAERGGGSAQPHDSNSNDDSKANASTAHVDGRDVAWEGWTFTWSFHDREGLVLHDVRCDGRSILHRASISEMWVPYADPDANWAWRNAFDEGEYGLGNSSHDLAAGREVPANAVLFAGRMHDEHDTGAHDAGPVALWEQDGGILWAHDGPDAIAARARELAIGFVATVGNYDYVFRWVFGLDGTLRFETDLSGIVLTKGTARSTCSACDAKPDAGGVVVGAGDERHGTVVADHVVAVNHQHFVALRLDFDVDGKSNSVRECDVEPDTDARLGGRNGFLARRTTLLTEKAAMRDADPRKVRRWEVFAPDARNATGHQRGYTIVPGATTIPMQPEGSPERALAGFAEHVLWVTRFHDEERFAAGDWPSQARTPGGLPQYVKDDEPIEDQDLVVWYVLGITHVARPEDYPVMPAVHAGVSFVPTGFFDRNPSLGQ
jgi:primary-amine oxidase